MRVREIDDDEGRRLVRIIRRGSGSVVTWRRAQMVLLSAQGMDAAAIARVAFTSEDRVRDVIRNFNADGFNSLYPRYKGGRQPKFTVAQRREIKQADFKGWTELLANMLAGGEANAHLRSYLKKVSVETWAYVNWLTHAKNAIRMDAEIGLKTVEHLLGVFTAARLRLGQNRLRCAACGSYQLVGKTCESCGWVDEEYEAPQPPARKRMRRPKGDCVPSSDISTFMRPEDVM